MERVRWLFLIFASVGIVLLAVGLYVARSTQRFVEGAETATGVVIENVWRYSSSHRGSGSGAYYPRVRFRTEAGQDLEFVASVGTTPPSYSAHEEVTVLYDPANPSHASIKGFWSQWLATVIVMILGIAFGLFGGIPLAWLRRQKRMKDWLRANGQQIQTSLDRVELDTSLTVNGSHPYRIVSQWLNPLTNQVHVFKSDSIWYDPADYVSGDTIGVWIDPKNPKHYAMEIGFLPRAAG